MGPAAPSVPVGPSGPIGETAFVHAPARLLWPLWPLWLQPPLHLQMEPRVLIEDELYLFPIENLHG